MEIKDEPHEGNVKSEQSEDRYAELQIECVSVSIFFCEVIFAGHPSVGCITLTKVESVFTSSAW